MSRRTTGGTLAAWLIIAAIVGFAGGAFFGVQSGSGEPGPQTTASTNNNNQAQTRSPEPTEEETTPAGQLTLSAPETVKAGEEGRFELDVKLESGEEGVSLIIERSLDDGETWERFVDQVTMTTDANGEASTSVWTGQTGVNLLRIVGLEDKSLVSNEVPVEVTD